MKVGEGCTETTNLGPWGSWGSQTLNCMGLTCVLCTFVAVVGLDLLVGLLALGEGRLCPALLPALGTFFSCWVSLCSLKGEEVPSLAGT